MMEIELDMSTMVLLCSLFLLLGESLIIVGIDPYIRREKKKLLRIVILLNVSLVMQNYAHDLFNDRAMAYARLIVSIYGYCVRPMILVLFCYIVSMEKTHWVTLLLVGINAVVHLTALFSGICFQITPDNYFIRGPLGYTCHFISAILLIYLLRLSASEFTSLKKANVIPMVNGLGITAAILLDGFSDYKYSTGPITFVTASSVVCSIFYYIWLHLQFVREHEKDLMAGERIKAMVSQMQPHFIYNSLTVIGSYLDDPDKAEEALEHFTGFLRGSIDLLDATNCISVQKEFETVDNYLYLVGKRFGEKLTVVRDTPDLDFYLPAFTIQALVENAVTHGIRKNKGGIGTLSLKSYETATSHVIEVQDNGIGFDVAILRTSDGIYEGNTPDEETHIGLRNVEERLRIMSDGKLEIQSTKGIGTTVKVIIPKQIKRGRT